MGENRKGKARGRRLSRLQAAQDHAERTWAKRVIIEPGSVDIVRHLQAIIDSPTAADRLERADASARREHISHH